jgi:DNA invertase Pin-like site-specific DNA recombinase
MKLGYARVSTAEQNLELQADALKAAGVERIFQDTAAGAGRERPALADLLERLREGDTVVVWRLDRLARSLKDLIDLSLDLERRGVQLVSLQENIDTTTTSGKLFFHIFGAIAEFERNLIVERTQAGLAAARARGRTGGRKPVLTADKQQAIAALVAKAKGDNTEPSFRAIARAVGASERTVRRFINGQYQSEPGRKAA